MYPLRSELVMEQDMHSLPAIRFSRRIHKGNTNMFLSARSLFPSWVVVLAVVAGLGVSAAFAQLEPDNVHVQPRFPSNRGMNSVNSSPDTNAGVIRKNVDLVLVPVTVTDVSNRLIKGLDQSSFKLYEGKQQQEIKHFGSEDAPVSTGILLNVSGSMDRKLDRAREAVTELLRSSNPQDEFFLITFANVPRWFTTLRKILRRYKPGCCSSRRKDVLPCWTRSIWVSRRCNKQGIRGER